jgi:hypothetical protein
MMVKPCDDLDFGGWNKIGKLRPFGLQSRKVKLICFDFEANRNVFSQPCGESPLQVVKMPQYSHKITMLPHHMQVAPFSDGS